MIYTLTCWVICESKSEEPQQDLLSSLPSSSSVTCILSLHSEWFKANSSYEKLHFFKPYLLTEVKYWVQPLLFWPSLSLSGNFWNSNRLGSTHLVYWWYALLLLLSSFGILSHFFLIDTRPCSLLVVIKFRLWLPSLVIINIRLWLLSRLISNLVTNCLMKIVENPFKALHWIQLSGTSDCLYDFFYWRVKRFLNKNFFRHMQI